MTKKEIAQAINNLDWVQINGDCPHENDKLSFLKEQIMGMSKNDIAGTLLSVIEYQNTDRELRPDFYLDYFLFCDDKNDDLISLHKQLKSLGITTYINYSLDKDSLYLDLNTQAKSHLYLYPDGTITGRYDYISSIDLQQSLPDIIRQIKTMYYQSKCGRDFGNEEWENA